jgi:hypothetical protein
MGGLSGFLIGRDELSGPKYEGEKVIVVQRPRTVATSWLQGILCYQFVYNSNVCRKDEQPNGAQISLGHDLEFEQTTEPDKKGGLVPCTVV